MCLYQLRDVIGLVDESIILVFSGGMSLGGGESSQGESNTGIHIHPLDSIKNWR